MATKFVCDICGVEFKRDRNSKERALPVKNGNTLTVSLVTIPGAKTVEDICPADTEKIFRQFAADLIKM